MSKNTAKVTVDVINEAQQVITPPLGVGFVIGETPFGIPWNPIDIITSIPQLEKLYGPITADNDFIFQCEEALKAGAKLRVCKVVSIATPPTPASHAFLDDASEELFTLTLKAVGTDADSSFEILPASNGDSNYFNLGINVKVPGTSLEYNELYENLKVPDGGTAGPYSFLKEVVNASEVVSIDYADLSALTGGLVPTAGTFALAVSTAGDAVILADYGGNQADQTGVYAFDPYVDSFILSALAKSETNLSGLYAIGKGYAELREDLVFMSGIDNSLKTATAISTALATLTQSKLAGNFGGGCKYPDPIVGGIREVLSLGELLGVILTTHATLGVWRSPTSYVSGLFRQALGVVNNFGSPASLADLNVISNAGGNMVVNKGGTIMQWDFYSMAPSDSPEKFLTVVFLELFLIRSLVPALEKFLGKPNHPSTWEQIYSRVKPFLDNLLDEAISSYQWNGDQFAQTEEDYQINTPADVQAGIYKAQLIFVPIVPIVEIKLDIVLTPAGASISVA